MSKGYCKDCANWKTTGPRDKAKYGKCSQYGETTLFESQCNKRFKPVAA